jgi:hypothetical protein
MGNEMLHWFVVGFSFGVGYAVATWILGRLLH